MSPIYMLQIGRNSWFGHDIGDDAEDFTFASVLDIYDLATIQEYLLFTGGLHYPFDREKIWRASCTWLRNNTDTWNLGSEIRTLLENTKWTLSLSASYSLH